VEERGACQLLPLKQYYVRKCVVTRSWSSSSSSQHTFLCSIRFLRSNLAATETALPPVLACVATNGVVFSLPLSLFSRVEERGVQKERKKKKKRRGLITIFDRGSRDYPAMSPNYTLASASIISVARA